MEHCRGVISQNSNHATKNNMAVANLPGPVDTFFVYSTGSSIQHA